MEVPSDLADELRRNVDRRERLPGEGDRQEFDPCFIGW